MTKPRIHLCIVNRNYPPDKGATGYHAYQLANYLDEDGRFDISIVTTSTTYESEPSVHRIARKYEGKKKLARLTAGSLECRTLLKKAISLAPDFYIIMTDPPQLNYWASRMLKGKKWALWTMDLYPQGYIANGLISESHILTSHYNKVLTKNPPNFLITLGNHQREFLNTTYKKDLHSITIPIGLHEKSVIRNDYPAWYEKGKIHVGYVGNLGEAHEPKQIYALLENLDFSKHKFIISCDGAKKKEVTDYLSKHKEVTILDFLPDRYMSLVDVQIVLLSPDWTHVCVPSKALSAIQYGSSVLFLGDEKSDTWQYVKDCGWRLENKDFTTFFSTLSKEEIDKKRFVTSEIVTRLQEKLETSCQEIANLIDVVVRN